MPSHRSPLRAYGLVVAPAAGAIAAALALGWQWPPLVAWLATINAVAIPLWVLDKRRARRSGRRVPEALLHLVSLAGASPAALACMWTLHHKTRKPVFAVGHVLVLALQAAAVGVWYARPHA